PANRFCDFSRYFPVIFKLVAYHPRVSGSLLLPLLPAIVGPGTLMEVLHSLLDLPLTASFLERFDADGASAAAFFAPSFFSSSGEVCAGAAALSVSTADGACPLLRALKAYLLRNEAGGHSVIWEAEDNAAVLASIDSLWRRLPITSRLSAVCKVVPAVLQVYFRVVLEDAPPFYIEKVLRVLLERFLMLCPVAFYMDALNRLFLSMILKIFQRHPTFVITLRTQILHAVYRHLTVRGALLSRHLCWVMGEYSSPHLLTESGARWTEGTASEECEESALPLASTSRSPGSACSPSSLRSATQTAAAIFAGFFDALESLAYEAIVSVGPTANTPASLPSLYSSGRSPLRAFPAPRGFRGRVSPGEVCAAVGAQRAGVGLSPGAGDTAQSAGDDVWGGARPSGAAGPGERARSEIRLLRSSDEEETDSEDLSDFSSSDESSISEEEQEGEDDRIPSEEREDEAHREELSRVFTPSFICVLITAMTKFALRYPQFMPRVVLCFSKLTSCFSTAEYASVRARVEACLHMTSNSSACASILQARVPAVSLHAGLLDSTGADRRAAALDFNAVQIPHLQCLSHYCHTPYNFVPGPRLHLFELPSYSVPHHAGGAGVQAFLARRLFTGPSHTARQSLPGSFPQWRDPRSGKDCFSMPYQGSHDSLPSPREQSRDAASLSDQESSIVLTDTGSHARRRATWRLRNSRPDEHEAEDLGETSACFNEDADSWPVPVSRTLEADAADDEDLPGCLFSQPPVTQVLLRRQIRELGYAMN
ncbi:hypothetical protein TGFOU_248150C, partial [Toxoplasma gondii FOU]